MPVASAVLVVVGVCDGGNGVGWCGCCYRGNGGGGISVGALIAVVMVVVEVVVAGVAAEGVVSGGQRFVAMILLASSAVNLWVLDSVVPPEART